MGAQNSIYKTDTSCLFLCFE